MIGAAELPPRWHFLQPVCEKMVGAEPLAPLLSSVPASRRRRDLPASIRRLGGCRQDVPPVEPHVGSDVQASDRRDASLSFPYVPAAAVPVAAPP